MDFIKNQFLSLVILIILVILFVDRCSQKPSPPLPPIIVRDTVWVEKQGQTTSQPHLAYTIPSSIEKITKEVRYLPDTNYSGLLNQYHSLLLLYFAKNIEKDSLKIDSLGYVYVTDTVSKNLLLQRQYNYNLRYPKVTTTITLQAKPTNQLYIGGGVQGNPAQGFDQIHAGLLLKNRKDQIYGLYGGLNIKGQPVIGISSYWKIRLKR